ncbi:hypothetical protein SeMB42_g03771 [Synchytrium endobioticum]|uniref:Intraflagellar transport protein 57 n=1 Tax=Synchytrium endobioticum TaxID=286115 RepID=A0A507D474_9FUNG|nr:hypothetical protein SeLEV6574_g03631 [Synchytrium endobioticum]TPX46266.1 hypothetical protein SeMB42_g03771 [Synchytrium endobioticum]
MDDILDKLRLLHYIRDFCRPFGFPPLNRYYFVVPASDPEAQFVYFGTLAAFLFKKCGKNIEAPDPEDDPNAVSATILSACKELDLSLDIAPARLKQGYGEGVVALLQALVDRVLQKSKFTFQKPVYKNDDYTEEAEVDVGAELTVEAEEVAIADDDNDAQVIIPNDGVRETADKSANQVAVVSNVDSAQWRLEVERVTPMLKVHIANDNKDWRVHLAHMEQYRQNVGGYMNDSSTLLTKIQAEVDQTLEKISSREKYINGQFEPQASDYRTLRERLSELKHHYQGSSGTVTRLTNELMRVSEELDSVKSRMDDIGSGMTDSKPLANIKQALAKLKSEMQSMDVRTGYIEHSLWHNSGRFSNVGGLAR